MIEPNAGQTRRSGGKTTAKQKKKTNKKSKQRARFVCWGGAASGFHRNFSGERGVARVRGRSTVVARPVIGGRGASTRDGRFPFASQVISCLRNGRRHSGLLAGNLQFPANSTISPVTRAVGRGVWQHHISPSLNLETPSPRRPRSRVELSPVFSRLARITRTPGVT